MAGYLMSLRPINAERRNAAIRAQTALDRTEKPAAQADLRALLDVMQAVIDAQEASIAAVQPIIDGATQALADMDTIIAGVDASTNAQLRSMTKDLARASKARVQDGRTLAREAKAKAQEAKDIARAIKRTVRVVT